MDQPAGCAERDPRSPASTMASESRRPICSLEEGERARRDAELATIVRRSRAVRELADGYEIELPRPPDEAPLLASVLTLIEAERRCCPDLAFELRFEPSNGPIRLRVLAPPAARWFLDDWIRGRCGAKVKSGPRRGRVESG